MIKVKISDDYTKTPGGRFEAEGSFSGEDFRNKLLEAKYQTAKQEGDTLVVDLDGGYGYATSFLEEAFGGLARKTKDPYLRTIKIISNEEPALVDKVCKYIEDALGN